MNQQQENEIKEAAHERVREGANIGVAVQLENGVIWSRGYQRIGSAFRNANRQMRLGTGQCAFVVYGFETYWRLSPEAMWEAV